MGDAYLARDLVHDRQVVLRLLAGEGSEDERFRERFLREAELAASLDHPGVLPILEVGEADGVLYVATRDVEGTDLASLLAREGKLEPERALPIVAELADVLDAARWSRGLVHGSLAPGVVLVAPSPAGASDERVFLSGFGFRQELPAGATLAEAARRLGNVDYLAPEQIEGNPVSPRSDVYALGCVLYHCLTGEPPFERDSPADVLRAHLNERPPSARQRSPGMPAAIDRVIQTATAKWPEERYSTCNELAAAAQAALAPSAQEPGPAPIDQRLPPDAPPVEPAARAAPPPSRSPRLTARRQTVLAAVGVAVLLAALVAGVIWLSGGETNDGGSATPSPPPAATPTEAAATEGQAAAESPAETVPPAEPPAEAAPAAEPGSDGPPRLIVSLGPGSLVRLDAETGEVLARVPIPFPGFVAADGGSIWVLGTNRNGTADLLVRVEADTNAITDIFAADVGGNNTVPSGLAAAGGSAWLSSIDSGRLYRYAPRASAAEPVEFDADSPEFYWPVAAGGSLWGSSRSALLRVDPATERVLARIDGVGSVLAAGKGFLWANRDEAGSDLRGLVVIDPQTNEAAHLGLLESSWSEFAVADGAVWASRHDGAIVRLDPATGEEKARIRLWRKHGPIVTDWAPIAAGGGAVWAASHLQGTVARYDLATGRIEKIDVGGMPSDLVVARGSVWVAVEAVTRERYVAEAIAICGAANERFDAATAALDLPDGEWELEHEAAWNEAAVRFSEEALAGLRALRPPQGGRAWVKEMLSLFEEQTDVLRQAAAAAAAGDAALAADLGWQRVEATHRKDELVGERLWGCPISLPA
jgi:serine/threonine-protein kinase